MNWLLQGDVGSGKIIVGFMIMLLVIDNGFQACLMVFIEILAQQYYNFISEYFEGMDLQVGFLFGSVKGKKCKVLFEVLKNGEIYILIGMYVLFEFFVVF